MLLEKLKNQLLFFDGAMGTVLQQQGLAANDIPALLNIENPEAVYKVHRAYLASGADFITTNTFSINDIKLAESSYTTGQLIKNGVEIARNAVNDSGREAYVVLDIGPIGQLLAPAGTLSFEAAYQLFKSQVVAGEKAGCDAVLIETITDLYEAKAAILAVKENSDLPIFCTMTFDENGRTFSGTDPLTMVTVLEGLGVNALGINCSTGPEAMLPLVKEIIKYSSIPVLVQPNAGLPTIVDGKTYFSLEPKEYAKIMFEIAKVGASILGGCCGTTPEFIAACRASLAEFKVKSIKEKKFTAVTSYANTVIIGEEVKLIGERINPTGKKKLKQALRENNISYVLNEAILQQDEGADILDINLGLPDINEIDWMKSAVFEIQAILDIPLQIDSANHEVLADAVRVYNGKPLINSVNGKAESMHSIFPIAKKYGACVLGLTLDEKGIPKTAEERYKIAKKIITTAESYGIERKNILIDCLVLTASAQQAEVLETLKTVQLVKEKLKVKTVLGVSNVSFGLPSRHLLNRTFLAMALHAGLDAPILNTKDEDMMETVRAFKVLANQDAQADKYIECYKSRGKNKISLSENVKHSLNEIVCKGLKDEVVAVTEAELKKRSAIEIINNCLIPALDEVGSKYEKGVLFLPQLIQSAEVAKQAFSILHAALRKDSTEVVEKHKIVLATVEGDIHDIGKNIVKVILENYGFEVIDLGRDVKPQQVLEAVVGHNVKLVGLSALMTTTVTSMAKTIELLRTKAPWCKVMVGGAVLNQQYANMIEADFYAADAREGVVIAQRVFKVLV